LTVNGGSIAMTARRGLLKAIIVALVVLAAGPVSNALASVAIESSPGGTTTKDTTPTFSGSASDTVDPVTLNIYEGSTVAGTPVRALNAEPDIITGAWSVTTSPALGDGTYTAIAEQTELGGLLETSFSSAVTFTIDTSSPTVTLGQPESPSNNTTPSFTGTASDTETVTVHIYKGSKAEGTVVSSATAPGNGGSWSSGEASPALSSGQYAAVATQPSSLGNPAGKSNTVTFKVDTSSPTVTLQQPESPSKDTTPSFKGNASDTETVTVHIYKGSKAEGTVVSSATASGTGGGWSSGGASPALADGQYAAIASQPSSLGNAAGKSNTVTFEVDTSSPTVTLNQPETPSNNAAPSFSGKASDTEPVTVLIYSGPKAEGSVVSSAKATGTGGSWSSGKASPSLASGEYSAVAVQESSLGNPSGRSGSVTFTVETSSPTVTLNHPPSPSNDTTPSFTGTASDTETVTVHIYKGSKAEGTIVSSATASGNGGSWSSGGASPALSAGEYTAIASQPSSLGNPSGKSNTVTFEVNTASPTVTLNPPDSPSKDTTPSFSGFASDTETVTIHVYKGSKAEGTIVSSATAEGNGGTWSSGAASPALADGQYTAIAAQPSSLGNPAGKSNTVTFVVTTAAPTVTLNQPKSPSNDTTPSFSGTASDTETVTVHIYAGTKAEGTQVSSAAATGSGGGWGSGQASPALSSGQYTALATQPSSLGNAAGKSSPVTFTVDTSSPTVTLTQPASPSKDTTPSFAGSASDSTTVTVHILNAANTEVSSATAKPGAGAYSTENESALSSGTYTAYATQASSLGNPAGVSNQVTFTVNTAPPTVTLASPALRSNNTTPSFTGTASDSTTVTIRVYAGTKAEGTVVSSTTASGTGGAWSSPATSPALANGQYTALATQPSSLGNSPGSSAPATFIVDTNSPTVTLAQPTTPSNKTTPSFTGTASDTTTVTVRIYSGTKATGTPVSSATATPAGGSWSSSAATPALTNGVYTAAATQTSSIGNSPGTSGPATFTVDTTAPKVTLNALKKPLSNNTTPAFTGTATDTTAVTVQIYAGAKAEGTVLSTATATGTGGAWSSANATPALPSGQYAAIATQTSSLGNPTGKSSAITFTVDTSSPTVTLAQPPTPSKNTIPSFKGSASASTPVTIQIYEGTKAEGSEVSSATATGTGGAWSSSAATPALSSGQHTYTAIATQESPLGNPAGKSAPVTFTVDTTPPVVTLVSPPSRSNNATPTFTGTATDTEPVTVQVYEGTKAEGTVIATATAAGTGGAWTSGPAKLRSGKHRYTAIATQKSSLGNPTGKSEPVTFTVDPEAPSVTLNQRPSPSNDTTPSFAGSASEANTVTITIYAGSSTTGSKVATAQAAGTSGGWSSGKASPALADGQYTAVASQESSFGNHVGESTAITFTVDTAAPTLTLSYPTNGSSSASSAQLVKGTAGTAEYDLSAVTVRLYSGPTPAGAPLQSAAVNALEGAWSTTFGGLGPGTYTVRAEQADSAGNLGLSPTSTFVVTGASAAGVAGRAPSSPAASFSWFPAAPRAGEAVSLVSSSTDATSPITAFAWDLSGTGAFANAGSGISTSFATPGNHVVQLRVTDANGLSSVATETIPVGASAFSLMQPFPIVRITSTGTRSGVRLRVLSVTASPGARVVVACRGRGCPAKSQARTSAASKLGAIPIEFRRFERSLRAGVTLEIRVSKAGKIGKYTRFVVRRGRLSRLDACLAPTATKPMTCPTS
jgi:hypothetical protein